MKSRRAQQWIGNNKLLIAFGLLAFCFFVSTIALAQSRKDIGSACKQKIQGPIAGALETSGNHDSENTDSYRLPRNVIPINYKLKLEPSLSFSKTFTGSVKIQLNVLQSTRNITLHSKKLGIISVDLKNDDNLHENLTTKIETITDRRDFLIIITNEEITKGRYTVNIDFSGKLEGLIGFYGSTLKNGRIPKNEIERDKWRQIIGKERGEEYFKPNDSSALMYSFL